MAKETQENRDTKGTQNQQPKPKKGFFERRKDAVGRGLGLSYLMDAGHFMSGIVKGFLTVPSVEQRESFEQALRRLRLTEKDLQERYKSFIQQFFLFLLAALAVLAYSVYLFSNAALGSGLVALLMMVVLIVYALRAHFWAFQIKHRKLGCTWQEWWNNKTTEEKDKDKQNIVKKK